MVDFQAIVANPEVFKNAVRNKNGSVDIDRLIDIGKRRLELQQRLQGKQAESNSISAEIKMAGKPTPEQIAAGKAVKGEIQALESQLSPVHDEFMQLLMQVPNLPSEDTPIGKDDNDNVVIRRWGNPKTDAELGFQPKEHWELGTQLGMIEQERAVKVSGSRFTYLLGDIALLEFALNNYGMQRILAPDYVERMVKKLQQQHSSFELPTKPFVMVVPPVMIKPEAFQRMARLEPREQRYYMPEDDLYLIGSAEHTLGSMFMDETIPVENLPVRLLGFSTSFRREAGTYGKDMKGILRLHQFDKLEMESFTLPEHSLLEQELLVAIQEDLMQGLNIPYEVVICSTGDQGDPDARHLDLNAWMPGQNKYRETHSADLMTDYQTRRLNTRYKGKNGEKGLLHTNDATALAGRTIIAVMENYQQADGSIVIPEVLRPFMGKEIISVKDKLNFN